MKEQDSPSSNSSTQRLLHRDRTLWSDIRRRNTGWSLPSSVVGPLGLCHPHTVRALAPLSGFKHAFVPAGDRSPFRDGVVVLHRVWRNGLGLRSDKKRIRREGE